MKLLKSSAIWLAVGAILGVVAAEQVELVCSGVRGGFSGLL